jgi:HSP20 family protein
MLLTREELFPLFNVRPGLDRFFEDFVEEKAPALPAIDVKETDGAILVEAELPGFKKSEIEVRVERGILHISAERKPEKGDMAKDVHRLERRYGRMQRLLALPETVESEKVEAAYREGVLIVTLPKKPAAKSKAVAVKVT